MNPQLWLNNADPDLDAIAVYADESHDECEGMGIVREGGEWALCSCTEAALLAAADEPEFTSVALSLVPQPGYRNAREFFTREQEPLKRAA